MSAYIFDGVEYPSVTTILGILDKPALIGWAAGLAVDWCINHREQINHPSFKQNATQGWRDASNIAKDIGTEVHHAIAAFHAGRDAQTDRPEVQNSLIAYLAWEKEHHVIIEASEAPLHDPMWLFAGTLDAVAMVDGVRTLVDYKTSRAVYNEYKYQISAYADLWETHHPDRKIERTLIVRLDKESGEFETTDTTKTRYDDLDTFMTCLELFYKLAKRRLKGNYRATNRGKVLMINAD